MVHIKYTKGFEGYQNSVAELYKDAKNALYILFTGDKNSDGVSWCPDCNVGKYKTCSATKAIILE